MNITLYKIDNKNKTREWMIEVDGGKYRTHYGEKNGKIVTTEWTKVEQKNIGKANETSLDEQAILEAKAIVKKQREKGYSENPVKKTGDVMLAKNYDDYKNKIKFPVYSQPKLDGIRCYVTKDGMFTRNHKPIVSCPHILEEINKSVLRKNFGDIIFDGELYNPALKENFNEICSLTKKTKPTKDDFIASKNNIQYWIYDWFAEKCTMKFQERFALLDHEMDENNQYIKILPTEEVTNQKQLDELYNKYLEEGNEGQMVRLNEVYEGKRSKNLLKRKEFQDCEVEILDLLNGTGNKSNMIGSAVCKLGDKQFNSNIKLDWQSLKDLLDNKKEYIGTIATVKFFNLTPDGIPRFPYVIKLHGKEKV
jgi:DNA ligase-1